MENNEETTNEFETSMAVDTSLSINVDSFINYENSTKMNTPVLNNTELNKTDSIPTLANIISNMTNSVVLTNDVGSLEQEQNEPNQKENEGNEELEKATNKMSNQSFSSALYESTEIIQQDKVHNDNLNNQNDINIISSEQNQSKSCSNELNVDKFLQINELIDKSVTNAVLSPEKQNKIIEIVNNHSDDDIILDESSNNVTKLIDKNNSVTLNTCQDEIFTNNKIRYREVKVTRLIHQTTTFVFRELIDPIKNIEIDFNLETTHKKKEIINDKTECRFLTQKQFDNFIETVNKKVPLKVDEFNLDHLKIGTQTAKRLNVLTNADGQDSSSECSNEEPLFIAKPKNNNHNNVMNHSNNFVPVNNSFKASDSSYSPSISSSSEPSQLLRNKRKRLNNSLKPKKSSRTIVLSDSDSEPVYKPNNKNTYVNFKKKRKSRLKTSLSNLTDFAKYKIDLTSPAKRKSLRSSVNSYDLDGVKLPLLKECSVKLRRIDIREHLNVKNSKLPQRFTRLKNNLRKS